MQKTYKLKLTPQTLKYLKKIKRKYKVKLSVGPIQDFDLEEFGIVPQPGYFIVSEGLTYIYVNNRQPYKSSHDLVVLHEIGHLLMHRYDFYQYQNQEESYANGFALSMATELGIKTSQEMINEMGEYSRMSFVRNTEYRKKRK
jgi:hypothetical protein